MRYIFVDERLIERSRKRLCEYCDKVIPVPKFCSFSDSISGHTDMNLLKINDNLFTNFKLPNELLSKFNVTNIKTPNSTLTYPNDVFLNAAVIGNTIVCKKSCIYEPVLQLANNCGFEIININQGYSKCNIAIVNESKRAVITEDVGIYNALIKKGFDVLLLNSHGVSLEPYEYGFIGGACGLIEDNLIFFGNIEAHKESERIFNFCKKYNKKIISLGDYTLYDYGGLVFVDI